MEADLTIQLSVLLGQGGAADAPAGYSRGLSEEPTPWDKATKAEVDYRPAHSDVPDPPPRPRPEAYRTRFKAGLIPMGQPATTHDGTVKRAVTAHPRECGTCEHFDRSLCSIVSGTIDPEMVCDLWRGPE